MLQDASFGGPADARIMAEELKREHYYFNDCRKSPGAIMNDQ
jgi:hypothetical protein